MGSLFSVTIRTALSSCMFASCQLEELYIGGGAADRKRCGRANIGLPRLSSLYINNIDNAKACTYDRIIRLTG